jgi:hypothetical protein
LNLLQVVWNGDAETMSGYQVLVNSLVWDNGYNQVVGGPTRGDTLLDITCSDRKVRLLLVV